nr:RNA-dependent RNA polymerase [Liriomyza bunyavirus]
METLEQICEDSLPAGFSGVMCPPKEFHTFSRMSLMPNIVIESSEDSESVTIIIENIDDLDNYSTISRNYVINDYKYKAKSIMHDYTFSIWANQTDMPLRDFFNKGIPEHLRLTPDVCFVKDNTLFVVEFATVLNCHDTNFKTSYGIKESKYFDVLKHLFEQMTLEDKSQKGFSSICFFIAVAGSSGILTNLQLNTTVGTELVARLMVSREAHFQLKRGGIVKDEDIELTEQQIRLKSWLNSLKPSEMDPDDEYCFDNYESCRMGHSPLEVSSILNKVFLKSIDEVCNQVIADDPNRFTYELHNMKIALDKYKSTIKSKAPNGFKQNQKSIVNIPFICIKPTHSDFSIRSNKNLVHLGELTDATIRLWHSCLCDYNIKSNDPEVSSDLYSSLTAGNKDEVEKAIDKLVYREDNPKSNKLQYHRTKADITQSDWEELAKLGIEGKKFKNADFMIEHQNESKKPFDLDINIEDISNLMNSDLSHLFSPMDYVMSSDTDTNIRSLLDKSMSLHDNFDFKDQQIKFLATMMKTPFYLFCTLVSDIANEVAISMRQHCERGIFVLKKLKDFPVYLLIKPTKSSTQCYFSILFQESNLIKFERMGKVFKDIKSNGVYCWTDFVSLNQSKIVNWTLCQNRFIAMVPYWLEFFGSPPHTIKMDAQEITEFNEDRAKCFLESYKMIMFSTLVSLADKAEIEETLSMSRFIFMEAFVAYPNTPKPYKMFEKFPEVIRSRLTVFIVQKLIFLSEYIVRNSIKPKKTDNEPGEGISYTLTEEIRTWDGLINPLTNFPLKNPGQMINLMYLGYVKNKHEHSEINADTKMLNKILVLEKKLTPEIKERIGKQNKPFDSGTSHEYNIDLIKAACSHSIKQLSGGYVSDYICTNSNTLRKLLVDTSVEEVFMTLKASSNFDESYYIYSTYMSEADLRKAEHTGEADGEIRETHRKCQAYYRTKVIEKSLKYVQNDKLSLADILPICYEEVSKNKCLRICIFKKQQHGGLREIYVLNFAERVIQYVIELAGRIICEQFPGETMTHPDSKRRRPEQHIDEARLLNRSGVTITTNTSADAAKWSQNHYPHKFAIMLCKFYSTEFHGLIWNTLKLWKNKKIKMSDMLLDFFNTNFNKKFYDEITQEVYDGFKGYNETPYVKKDLSYVTTRTGMMQGILHYVSSAFHAIINEYTESLIVEFVRGKIENSRVVVTTMESSDDSALLLTVNVKDTDDRLEYKTMLMIVSAMHYFKKNLAEEVAIKNSVKTTFNCSRVFEFNSKFFFSNFHYEPDIKQLFASVLISERESLIERQEESYTLLSSYVASGGSFYTAGFVQMSQAFLHYRGLGFNVSSNATLLARCLHIIPDPSLGFFLMDNPVAPGLSGFSYNVWIASYNPYVSSHYADSLGAVLENGGTLETTNAGILVRNVFLTFAKTEKLRRLKKRAGVPDDWISYLDEHPDLLFRNAKTTNEYMYKVALKLSQRGVASSLSTGVQITNIVASSVFSIDCRVISLHDQMNKVEAKETQFKGENVKRVSLFDLIKFALSITSTGLTDEQRTVLFPYHFDYEDLRNKLDKFSRVNVFRKSQEKRRVITNLTVYDKESKSVIPIMTLLSKIWFPEITDRKRNTYSTRISIAAFKKLKERIKWLDLEFSKSLSNSPFEHAHQMINWLMRFEDKPRVLCLLGAPIISKKGRSTVLNAIIQNFNKFYSLSLESRIPEEETTIVHRKTFQWLLGAMSYTYNPSRKLEVVKQIIKSSKLMFDYSKTKSRVNTLATIRSCLHDRPDIPLIMQQIEHNKRGHVGFWRRRQKFNKAENRYVGNGVWDGVISGVKTQIIVDTIDDRSTMTRIFVRKWDVEEMYDFVKSVTSWCKESRVSTIQGRNFPPQRYQEGLLKAWISNTLNYDKFGTPVYLMEDNEWFLSDFETESRLNLTIQDISLESKEEQATIRISYKDPGVNQFMTILSLSLLPSDWDQTSSQIGYNITGDHLSSSWITNTPLDKKEAYKILKYTRALNTRNLLVSTLKSALFRNGVTLGLNPTNDRVMTLPNIIPVYESKKNEDFNVYEVEIDDKMRYAIENMFDVGEPDEIDTGDEVIDLNSLIDDMAMNDYDLEGDYYQSNAPIVTRITGTHLIFNNYIESLVTDYSLSRINDIMTKGTYYLGEESVVECLKFANPILTFTKLNRSLDGIVEEPSIDEDLI